MVRKKKQLPILEKVTITGIAAEGKAIARIDDCVVFVPFVVPGDVVDLQVTRKKSSFMEARSIRLIHPSDKRIEPTCQHYGTCGGCKWQILPYEEQLRYKQQQVVDNLTRIAKVELPEITPILGSEKIYAYRNKLEYTFSNKKWRTMEEMVGEVEHFDFKTLYGVGFHIPGMFDKVLDIQKCWLQEEINDQLRNEIRRFALANDMTFFDIRKQEGLLRTMIIRTGSNGELMLIVVFYEDDAAKRNLLMQHIADTFPQITSLLYVINGKANDTITDQEVVLFRGKDHIMEEMEGLRFKVGPKSFYQTNSDQAYRLYTITRNLAQLTGKELVFDLYTGTGTIANFVAKKAKKVIGIEYVPEAIEDAKINSKLNNLANTLFFAGDMRKVLNQAFIDEHGKPDVVITDPPRAGMHEEVIDTILFAEPKRIVYVSCNPATQARDIQLLDVAYKVTAVQPVDMFPHTQHVENVVLLEKR